MADTRKEPSSPEFLEQFASIEDPRQAGKILYPLSEIFLLVLCAVISGADGWTSIALYGRKKISLLRRFLPYEHGTPSHDQLGILFSRLDMDAFQRCFATWVSSRRAVFGGVVAIDGKRLKRSFDAADGKTAIHMISAWSCEHNMVLGQRKVDDTSNEITAIPELLRWCGCRPPQTAS